MPRNAHNPCRLYTLTAATYVQGDVRLPLHHCVLLPAAT